MITAHLKRHDGYIKTMTIPAMTSKIEIPVLLPIKYVGALRRNAKICYPSFTIDRYYLETIYPAIQSVSGNAHLFFSHSSTYRNDSGWIKAFSDDITKGIDGINDILKSIEPFGPFTDETISMIEEITLAFFWEMRERGSLGFSVPKILKSIHFQLRFIKRQRVNYGPHGTDEIESLINNAEAIGLDMNVHTITHRETYNRWSCMFFLFCGVDPGAPGGDEQVFLGKT